MTVIPEQQKHNEVKVIKALKNKSSESTSKAKILSVKYLLDRAIPAIYDTTVVEKMNCNCIFKFTCKHQLNSFNRNRESVVRNYRKIYSEVHSMVTSGIKQNSRNFSNLLEELSFALEEYYISGALREQNQDESLASAHSDIERAWKLIR